VINDKPMDDINRKKRDLTDLQESVTAEDNYGNDKKVEPEAGSGPEKPSSLKMRAASPKKQEKPLPKKHAKSLQKQTTKKSHGSKTVQKKGSTKNSPPTKKSLLNNAGSALYEAVGIVASAIPCLEEANEKHHYLQNREVTLNLNDFDDVSALDDDNIYNLASAKANKSSKDEFRLDGQLCLQAEKPWSFTSQEVANEASMPPMPPEPIKMPHRRKKNKAVSSEEISLSEVTAGSIGSALSVTTRAMARKQKQK
jgi:FtsZ-interacting cell division protein YlmF